MKFKENPNGIYNPKSKSTNGERVKDGLHKRTTRDTLSSISQEQRLRYRESTL